MELSDITKTRILENAPAIIAFHGIKREIIWANRLYRESTGLDLNQLIGKKCWDAWGLSRPCRGCPVTTAIETGRSTEAELTPESQSHWPKDQGSWLVRATPISDDAGNIIGAIEVAFEISKMKELEQSRLNEAEARFHVIAENALDAIILIDDEGRVVYCNPASSKMFGYSAEEMIGKDVHAMLMPEEYLEQYRKGFEKFRQTGEGAAVGKVLELTAKSKSGRKIPIEIAVAPLRIQDSWWAAAIIRDISTRKRLVETIREERELLRAILDNIPVMITLYNTQGELLLFNKAVERLLGWGREETAKVTDWMTEAIPDPEYRKEVWDYMMAAPPEEWREFRIKAKNGDFVESSWSNVPISDNRLIGIGIDIRPLLAKEEALRKSKERFELLVDQLKDIVWTTDMSGTLIDINHAFEDISGVPEGKLRANPRIWLEMVHPDDREIVETCGERLLTDGQAEAEYRIIRPDGEIRWIRDRRSLLYDGEGTPILMGGVANDITDLKKKEEEKEVLQRQLIQAQKMEAVGQLAGGVAHDFNNMLSAIIGYSQIAMMKIDKSNPIYSDLEEILKAGQRSADLTRQLLAFARKQTISPRVLDLNDAVSQMLKMLQRLIGEDIEVVWKPGAHLWPVKMDPSQLDQILANLAVNARDAIAGVGRLTLETENVIIDEDYCKRYSYATPGEFVMLAVSDDGHGMSQEILDRIFEPFFTTKEQGKGTGLGLSTVYGIVKQNEGFINVYSEPDRGTTFKIYLPRYAGVVEEKTSAQNQKVMTGNGETILVVEDAPQILKFCREALENLGYRVLTASTPTEAIDFAGEYSGRIDLLLTDVVMPEMNGRELASQIQSAKPEIKVLFMSGYTPNAIVHHGILDEDILFVQKPLELGKLAEKVREALAQKRPDN